MNRINAVTIEAHIREPIEKANATYVQERTGFAIEGVSLGQFEPAYISMDEDLLRLGNIWAAPRTPNDMFHLTSKALLEMTNGALMSIN